MEEARNVKYKQMRLAAIFFPNYTRRGVDMSRFVPKSPTEKVHFGKSMYFIYVTPTC